MNIGRSWKSFSLHLLFHSMADLVNFEREFTITLMLYVILLRKHDFFIEKGEILYQERIKRFAQFIFTRWKNCSHRCSVVANISKSYSILEVSNNLFSLRMFYRRLSIYSSPFPSSQQSLCQQINFIRISGK